MAHSNAKLYRALLKAAKPYDTQVWRRSLLLQHPCVLAYTADGASAQDRAHALFFLQTDSNAAATTQRMVQANFRRASNHQAPSQQSLSHGFEVLRALKSGHEQAAPTVASSHVETRGSSVRSPLASGVRRAESVSSSVRTRSARTAASQEDSSSAASSSGASGPALHRKPQLEYGSHTSILGRMSPSALDLPRATAPAAATPSAADADPNHDSKYAQTVYQLSVYAQEYLQLVSAGSSTASNASSAPATSSAQSAATGVQHGHELHLIDISRMKHQQVAWGRDMCAPLTRQQQLDLEALVQTLGVAVEAKSVEQVLAFQARVPTLDRALAAPLMSNNLVMDAWLEFLYVQQQFPALVELFQLRLTSGMPVSQFGLSRKSLCKVLVACAIEGNLSASMMVLRESSWAALSTDAKPVQTDNVTALSGVPSSVNRLPSWVPTFYTSTSAAVPIVRTNFELEDQPDILLAASGDGFGVETQSIAVSPPSVIMKPTPRQNPRLTINLHARPLHRPSTPLSSLSSLLGGGLLRPPTPTSMQTSHASMSTRARSKPTTPVQVQPPVAAVAPPADAPVEATPPPTPLPIIDLWTELSLDSRLMELAIITAVRSEDRASEFKLRDQAERVRAHAKANPVSADASLNLSIHEHAAALFEQPTQQARAVPHRAPRVSMNHHKEIEPDSEEDELEEALVETLQPPTVFETINSAQSQSPLAFQLWSVMMQQKVPLHHSATFVHLIDNLRSHLTSNTGASRPSASAARVLLQTVSSEMQASRTTLPLRSKFLRGDVSSFLSSELAINQHLALSEDGADHAWQCLAVMRQMHRDRVKPTVQVIAQLYQSLLEAAEPSFARSKLLQDCLIAIEDFAAVDPNFTVDTVLDQATLDLEVVQPAVN